MPVSDKNLARFKRAVKQLNAVIRDCKSDCADDEHTPFAYLDGNNNFALLTGEFGIGDDDSILITETLTAQGGDW
ncbi:TPA: hypothetical protein QHB43_003062 [Aeromonas hydrophila subsp. hydrophila]|nr:hypothetical protein [Aeromonas hydrophila subsp. hydrophila]